MNSIQFPATVQDLHYVDSPSHDGMDAVLTLRTPVIGSQTREVMGTVETLGDMVITVRRKGEYEDRPRVGTISATNAPGRFTFLMPPAVDGKHGLALGSFVVTQEGVVAVIVEMKADTGDLFRLLVQTGTLDGARLMTEQRPLEFKCVEIGGLGTDIHEGDFIYYHSPVYPPLPGESVHVGPGGHFFDIDGSRLPDQSPQLIAQLATICAMRDVAPSVAANMIKNAAAFAKFPAEEYMQSVVGGMMFFADPTRIDALVNIFQMMFPGSAT